MIYVASPYTHPKARVRERRYNAVCAYTAYLMRQGHNAYSPIVHTHPLIKYGLPTGFEFYHESDVEMLSFCKDLHILRLDGWEASVGVREEWQYAMQHKKEIYMVDNVKGVYEIQS